MRTFLVAMGIAVILVGGGWFLNMSIDNVTENMNRQESVISAQLQEANFAKAEEEIEALTEYIDEKRIILASVIDHKLLDDIEVCVAEIKGCSEEGEVTEALVRCRRLEHLIEHLPINYAVTLENVL